MENIMRLVGDLLVDYFMSMHEQTLRPPGALRIVQGD